MNPSWQIRLRRHRQALINTTLTELSGRKQAGYQQGDTVPSAGGEASQLPSSSLTQEQGVRVRVLWGHLVTEWPLPPPILYMVFIKLEVCTPACRSPSSGFCFTQCRGRNNCSPFILTLLFLRKQDHGRPEVILRLACLSQT